MVEAPYDKFMLSMVMGNDAMQTADDIADRLIVVAQAIRSGNMPGTIRDINGNTIGGYGVLHVERPKPAPEPEPKGVFGDEPFRMGSEVSAAGTSMR